MFKNHRFVKYVTNRLALKENQTQVV